VQQHAYLMKHDPLNNQQFMAYLDAHGDFVHAINMPIKSELVSQKYHVNTFQDGLIECFSDVYNFNRVIVVRNNLYLSEPVRATNTHNPMMFGINIALAGNLTIDFEALNKRINVKPMQTWLRKGQLGTMHTHLPDHIRLRGIGIDFDDTLLEQLTHDQMLGKAAEFFLRGKDVPETEELITPSPMLFLMAQQILSLPCAKNDLDLMRLESAALGLLAQILREQPGMAPETVRPEYVSVVCHLLETQLHAQYTIPQLARLAGINECYLKKQFKAATGYTLAQYARKCKMDAAIDLLARGLQATAIAQHLGYCNVSHFSRVFQQHFGHQPTTDR
jgi:AraC-like DNA-binding protein